MTPSEIVAAEDRQFDQRIPGSTNASLLSHQAVSRALQYVEVHYSRRVTLEDIAEHVTISKFHFSRIFHAVVGISFKEYLTLLRRERARELLPKDPLRSVTRIALEAGFGTLRNCEWHFMRLTNETPSQYRARALESVQGHRRGTQDISRPEQGFSRTTGRGAL
jgi:transcriptional regulator GlxA family with amidase domain